MNSKRVFDLTHEWRLARPEFCGLGVYAALLEINSIPLKTEELIQSTPNVVSDHEQTSQRWVKSIPEERVVTVRQTDSPGVFLLRALVKIRAAWRE